MLPDVISEMLHFIKVPKLNQSRSNSRLTYGQSKKSDGKAMQVLGRRHWAGVRETAAFVDKSVGNYTKMYDPSGGSV